jgi:hypothetical protein
MNASRGLSRRRAYAAIIVTAPHFALACNLLVSVPDPIPLSTDDASAPEAGAVLADVSASDVAVSSRDAPSEATSAADSSLDAADAADSSPDAADSSPDAADAAPVCDASADDALNCGWCGHSCGSAPCQNGVCQPTAIAGPDYTYRGIYALLIASNELYFTDWASGPPIYRIDLPSGAPVGLGSDAGLGATLSRWGNTIFYGQAYSVPGGNATDLYALDMDSGAPARVAQGAPDVVRSVKEDGAHIFYALETQGLFRISLSPGAPDGGINADQLDSNPGPDFDLRDGTLYVAVSGSVFSLPSSAEASTPRVPLYAFGEPHGITTDGMNLYWYDAAANTINRGSLEGTQSSILATLPAAPQGIALDAVSVYVAVGSSIMAVDKDGTRLRTYASWDGATDQDIATALAFDDGYVYWGRNVIQPSSVWRVAK